MSPSDPSAPAAGSDSAPKSADDPAEPADDAAARRHAEKMTARKAARDRMMASKTVARGLLIVHTGRGKGKSTAAFGMVMRAIGHGRRVAVVQFVKGKWESGERAVLAAFPDLVDVFVVGEGFTWETRDRQRDRAAAEAGFVRMKELLTDPRYGMVLLDELNIVLRDDLLPLGQVLDALRDRCPEQHVIVTGRNAREELIEQADLVTEMTLVKHPFRDGMKAQAGVEY